MIKTFPPSTHRRPRRVSLFFLVFLLFAVLWAARAGAATEAEQQKESVLSHARALMDQDERNRSNMSMAVSILKKSAKKFSDDVRFPLYLAEAYYRMVDPLEKIETAYPFFEKTGSYAQKAINIDPNRLEAHYWYGLFLLRKAQHVSIFQAYFVTKQGIAELEKVRQSLPAYDHGGASRVLSLLHLKAPGWSPFGDLDKAVRFAEQATQLDPEYLLNRLYLAEAYQRRGDKEAAIRECREILNSSSTNNPFKETARSLLLALE
ncbi:MAG: tetratricopeptide repeat protein [Deltaproteobacteria bacterium]|jgi:tetratricopeptide (TPR) repeat protein